MTLYIYVKVPRNFCGITILWTLNANWPSFSTPIDNVVIQFQWKAVSIITC